MTYALLIAALGFTDLPVPTQPDCPEIAEPIYDPVLGLPPADTGARQVFHGHDYVSLYWANEAAKAVKGAVVLDRIVDMPTWLYLHPGVLYTGGGLRRICGAYIPALAMTTANPYPRGIVIDSVVFDGNWDTCGSAGDWRYDNALSIRGRNTVRNSVFVDSPSESITSCGAVLEGNVGWHLAGSFVHKSCATGQQAADILVGNRVAGVNLLGDAGLGGHSEGAVTFSAAAGAILLMGNVFVDGLEGVYGVADSQAEGVLATGDCYQGFPRLLTYYDGARPETFRFPGTRMVRVGL